MSPIMRKARRTMPSEHTEQTIVVKWLRSRGWEVFSVNNEIQKNNFAVYGWRKAHGLLPGAPDLIIIEPSGINQKHTCIEMKRTKGGVVSPEQNKVLGRLSRGGWNAIIGFGSDNAIEQLKVLGY